MARAVFFAGLCLLLTGRAALAADAYDLRVVLDPEQAAIEIDAELTFSRAGEHRFRLAPWIELRGAEPARSVRAFEPGGGILVLQTDAGAGQTISLDLGGTIPARDSEVSGSIAAADGFYLPGHDAWIPLPERESTARYRLAVEVALPWRAVATLNLVEERESDGVYRASFAVDSTLQAPSLFAGPYTIGETVDGERRLRSYFHAGLEPLAEEYRQIAGGYIERFEQSIGPYPYNEFHIVSAPLPVGLGFPNLTYVGRRVLPLPFMRGRSLAHEVLHAWWGNGVETDPADGNWAEGLTTYQADYALAEDAGADAAREMRINWLRDYAALPAERDRPVRAFRAKYHQAAQVIGYNKVAFVLHMLRSEIGTDAFDAALASLWRERRFGRAGWDDLQAAFERSSGRDLDWFFRQWIDRAGAPQLELGEHRVEAVDGGYVTRIEIRQAAPLYRLGLPLRLDTVAGPQHRVVEIDAASNWVELPSVAEPTGLEVDPDSHLFRRLDPAETPLIMRDVTLDADTATLVASDDADFRQHATALARRLLDTAPRLVDPAERVDSGRPILLITSAADLPRLRARHQLPEPPRRLEAEHSAAAWTTRRGDGSPALVVVARDSQSLAQLMRPLPHYGGRSFVFAAGARVVDKGVWKVESQSLRREFRQASGGV